MYMGIRRITGQIIKIRVQDQLDIPAGFVNVYLLDKWHRRIDPARQIGESKINIDVDDSLSLHEYKIGNDGKLLPDRPYLFLDVGE